jgi:hypothetical protein
VSGVRVAPRVWISLSSSAKTFVSTLPHLLFVSEGVWAKVSSANAVLPLNKPTPFGYPVVLRVFFMSRDDAARFTGVGARPLTIASSALSAESACDITAADEIPKHRAEMKVESRTEDLYLLSGKFKETRSPGILRTLLDRLTRSSTSSTVREGATSVTGSDVIPIRSNDVLYGFAYSENGAVGGMRFDAESSALGQLKAKLHALEEAGDEHCASGACTLTFARAIP